MEREPTRQSELKEVAGTIPDLLELAARYGNTSQQFVDRLERLITTKTDGTSIVGSINPLFVGHDFEPERNYIGDQRGLPKLYAVSGIMQGRVVDTHYRSKQPSVNDEEITRVGVWVWTDGVAGGRTEELEDRTEYLNLLDGSVEFVEHVADCKLPRPGKLEPNKYGRHAMDD